MRLDTRTLADIPRLETTDELSDEDCSWRNPQYGRNVGEDFPGFVLKRLTLME